MKSKGRRATAKSAVGSGGEVDPRFAPVVKAFARDGRVVYGGKGKGFGSSALKVDGKLFALMSSRGLFVAKLPRQRVDELTRQGTGRPFDPGHGRLMKEWLEVDGNETSWLALAREARLRRWREVEVTAQRRPLSWRRTPWASRRWNGP